MHNWLEEKASANHPGLFPEPKKDTACSTLETQNLQNHNSNSQGSGLWKSVWSWLHASPGITQQQDNVQTWLCVFRLEHRRCTVSEWGDLTAWVDWETMGCGFSWMDSACSGSNRGPTFCQGWGLLLVPCKSWFNLRVYKGYKRNMSVKMWSIQGDWSMSGVKTPRSWGALERHLQCSCQQETCDW